MVAELRRRGLKAFDADDDGFSEDRGSGRWGWRRERVEELLGHHDDGLVFFAGCSEEQAQIRFDTRILLTVPEDVLIERLRSRTTNSYGSTETERRQILSDRVEIEPLLRRSADLVLDTTATTSVLADVIVGHVRPGESPSGRTQANAD
ncbi:MAG: shikimate kinase [Conexibacter sp.]|nr:shikimate kinase [Conexibacter sp.]